MEILALLLLGLIAMLAIVPPIIRGKLDESPLATTQSFQRCMQEISNSVDPGPACGGHAAGERKAEEGACPAGGHARGGLGGSRRRAAVRRNRVLASLTVLSAFWGTAALLSGRAWCLIAFTAACGMLVLFWGLTIIVPILPPRSGALRPRRVARPPHREAS